MRAGGAFVAVCAVFAVVGLALLSVAGGLLAAELNFRRTAVETYGVITRFGDSHGAGGNYADVYVEYAVNGQTYESRLNYYASSMRAGQTLRLYCDPANPLKAHGAWFVPQIILASIGALFAVLGGAGVFAGAVMPRRRARLRYTGVRYRARLTGVERGNLSFNGAVSTVLLCEAADGLGNTRRFKSGSIWPNKPEIDAFYSREPEALPGIDVYADPYDEKKYFVDTDVFLNELISEELTR